MDKKSRILFILVILGLFWLYSPVVFWYFSRLTDGSDSPVYVLAIIALIFILAKKNRKNKQKGLNSTHLCFGIFLAGIFAFLPEKCPNLIKSSVVAISLVSMAFSAKISPMSPWPSYGLALTGLPLIASMQFFAGYPLRIVVSWCNKILLNLGGLDVKMEGVCLRWGEKLIAVDAPCSGIKMLWAGFLTTFIIAALNNFGFIGTLFAAIIAGILLILGNIFRANALFFTESGIIDLPEVFHTLIGLSSYVITLAAIVWCLQKFANKAGDYCKNSPKIPTCNKFSVNWLVGAVVIVVGLNGYRTYRSYMTNKTNRTYRTSLRPSSYGLASRKETTVKWPAEWNGTKLVPQKMSEKEKVFAANFPGEISKFSAGNEIIILRHITAPTRKLHPAADCFRAMGYRIKPLSWKIYEKNRRYGRFEAQKGQEKLIVRERIWDEKNNSWEDVSSWYWAALTGGSVAPWWSITVISGRTICGAGRL